MRFRATVHSPNARAVMRRICGNAWYAISNAFSVSARVLNVVITIIKLIIRERFHSVSFPNAYNVSQPLGRTFYEDSWHVFRKRTAYLIIGQFISASTVLRDQIFQTRYLLECWAQVGVNNHYLHKKKIQFCKNDLIIFLSIFQEGGTYSWLNFLIKPFRRQFEQHLEGFGNIKIDKFSNAER